MNTSLHTIRRTIGVFAVALAVTAPVAAQASTQRPAGMTPQEFKALMIRSQALNDLYGVSEGPTKTELRAYRLRGEALNRLYGNAATRMSPAEFRAMVIRGEALNRLARSGVFSQPRATSGGGGGLDWGDFGIGAGAMLGLVLLATGLAAGAHYSRRGRIGAHIAS